MVRSIPQLCGLAVLALSLALASCVSPVGPRYQKPDVSDVTPAQWSWQEARPSDHVPKGDWWRVFGDEELDALERRALAGSPTLRIAMSRVEQARAHARGKRLEFVPDIRFNPAYQRQRTSGNLPTPVPVDIPSAHIDSFTVPLDLSYEIDLWGRVRRSFESARASAAASAADYNNLLLTLTADVAVQYFTLRALDSEAVVLRRTIALRQSGVEILEQRFRAGTLPETDLARARTEVSNARADLSEVSRLRQETAGQLGTLCGEPAGRLELPESPLGTNAPPAVPVGLPADLLERRPDIASAERQVAARNADVGVAVATYYPTVRLTGNAGYLSSDLEALFSPDSRTWSLGPSASLPLTGYGLIAARVRQAKAAREESIARYRETVLGAIRDVESSLAQIRHRGEQAVALGESLASATRAAQLTLQRYDRGVVSYLELLDADRTRLLVELRYVQVLAQQQLASVRLIKALGGGWEIAAPATGR